MNVAKTIQNLLPETSFTCFVIPSLFSAGECEALLDLDIRNSFQTAISNYPTYYRNNDRLVVDNEELAAKLFQKVRPYLPETIKTDTNIQSENGTWHLQELNSRLRFCKYSANQYFHRHLDGIHYRSETVQSKLTFMIYLNSATEFGGGRTLFYKTKDTNEVWASYIPKQGDLIVFDHNVWHEGEMLTEGEKFVLRSDILYSRVLEKANDLPFMGHLGYIWSLLKFDENTILSGGRDKEIKIWSVDGTLLQSLKGHENSILCIEKLDNDTFITGSRDRKIMVWEKQNNAFIHTKTIDGHAAVVLSLYRINNETFASSGGDNTVKIIGVDGRIRKNIPAHDNWVWKVVRLSDNIIATASEDQTIKISDLEKESPIATFTESCAVISLAYDNPSRKLVSGNLNGDITVRSLNTNFKIEKTLTFAAHNGIIRTLISLPGNQIASGGEDNKVKIWDIRNGQLLKTLEHDNFVQSMVLDGTGKLLSASYDGTIKSWDIDPIQK